MSSDTLDPTLLKKVMCLGFTGYITRGIGVIVIKEPANLSHARVSEELLNYIACNPDDEKFPQEAEPMMKDYDPIKECVVAIIDKQGKTLVIQLTALQAGITPIEAYRAWSRASGMGRFVPGELLFLKELTGGIEGGHYIFLGRQGVMMRICEAGIDDDEGDITLTRAEYLIHSDFEECFEPVLGVIVEGVAKK